jgi:lysophospholipase L1-like esterase
MLPVKILGMSLVALSVSSAQVKVACVGDSITEGFGTANPVVDSYPARLQRLLGTNYMVRNYGVSGRTLLRQGDVPYWREATFTNSQNFGPDVVIIQLGTNDSKPYNWRYGTNFVRDYKELIAVYAGLTSAPEVFLCAPCPVFRQGAFNISPSVIATNIAPAVRALAAELGRPLIDLHARMTNAAWFPDTVHPNGKGAAAMAAVMFEGLAGGLPQEAAPELEMARVSASRVILSWPAKWGGLVPETATALGTNAAAAWTIQETSPPVSDGVVTRQTNTLGNNVQRWFRLARP